MGVTLSARLWVVVLCVGLVGCAAEAPTARPASKSAVAPIPEPGAAPAAAPPAATEQALVPEFEADPVPPAEGVKTPWHDARVGDMAKYRIMGGMTQTMEVTAVADEEVNVKIMMEMGGNAMPSQEQTFPRFTRVATEPDPNAMPEGYEVKNLGTETVEVAGRKLTCNVTQVIMTAGDRKLTAKTWTCDDVLTGVVRTTSDMMGEMQVIMELVDFRRGDGGD